MATVSIVLKQGPADRLRLGIVQWVVGGRVGGGGVRGEHVWGEAIELNHVCSAEHHGIFDDVLQLPDISRQRMPHQLLQCLFRHTARLAPTLGVELPDEVLDQQRDVLAALRQRWQFDFDDVKSIEEIFPEPPQGNLLRQGLIGGGNDAHIGFQRLGGTKWFKFMFLQHAQQLDLQRAEMSATSSRNSVPWAAR